jgi:hypothetical protein
MDAGREMDALVAEKVMGYKIHIAKPIVEAYFEGKLMVEFPNGLGMICGPGGWSPSTNMDAAWEVVEHITGKGCDQSDFFLECWSDGEWYVSFKPLGYSNRKPNAACDGKITGKPSAPLAICRAALALYETERE